MDSFTISTKQSTIRETTQQPHTLLQVGSSWVKDGNGDPVRAFSDVYFFPSMGGSLAQMNLVHMPTCLGGRGADRVLIECSCVA